MVRTDAAASPVTPAADHRLDQAVRREAPALLAYFSRRVDDPADAADLLSDVLVVIWRRIDAMPPEPGPARMWMFGIARRVLAGGHRSARRRRALTDRLRHELRTADPTVSLDGSATPEPADGRIDRLTIALDRLSPADREILALVHWDSFSLVEAAQHLHLRLSTTRSRYHRARTRLKQLLEGGHADS